MITHISTLVAVEAKIESDLVLAESTLAEEQSHHPVDFGIISGPVVIATSPTLACDNCEDHCVMVTTLAKSGLHLVDLVCRCCINAIRNANRRLEHTRHPTEICYRCVQRRDNNGFLVQSSHVYLPRAEFDARVAQGLVTLDDDSLVIHDLVHSDDEHCPGCVSFRHPGCAAGPCDSLCE